MKIKVELKDFVIKDVESGKEFPFQTIQTLAEVGQTVVETEKEVIEARLMHLIDKVYDKQ